MNVDLSDEQITLILIALRVFMRHSQDIEDDYKIIQNIAYALGKGDEL